MTRRPSPAERTLLVTGAGGQVGHELQRELAPLGRVVAPARDALDLSSPDSVRAAVRALQPTVVVNAGAYTAVDRAESEADAAHAVNAVAPGVLAEECQRAGAVLVHYSTDYVFDGSKSGAYVEEDAPNPLGVYGRTKLEGERAIGRVGGAYLVLRTSWVYGRRGRNFMLTMLGLARSRPELRVVCDQVGAPTWSRMIATATAHVLAAASADDSLYRAAERAAGVYHLTAGGVTSWHGFAEAVLEGDPARAEQVCERVVPIATAEFPTPARRPANSVLDNGKLAAAFGVRLPHWREQLALALAG